MVHARGPAPAGGHRVTQFADVINPVDGGEAQRAGNVLYYLVVPAREKLPAGY